MIWRALAPFVDPIVADATGQLGLVRQFDLERARHMVGLPAEWAAIAKRFLDERLSPMTLENCSLDYRERRA